ncbi:uncharacterized protein EI90DRAFT_1876391 [Cantharellus anzutake]|uniref:uncharacterized protein n=1 Tax=Cantharellus anzutake TaxID=1750568 RepID=UPI0019031407|nr:uncharacterized protein EI90DRAFT_1876391 [Cantharellus anzutake]KAF8326830.1 hypothetical protein EI90DRAFT_1876391 [Cantharellus anzutake]
MLAGPWEDYQRAPSVGRLCTNVTGTTVAPIQIIQLPHYMESLLNIYSSSASVPVASSGRELPLCSFCGRNFSRYTCPTCNAAYCSLSCYKSQAHNQCTEPFYRKVLEDDIQTDSKIRTNEERKRILDMLKRLEEEDLEGFPDDSDEDDKQDSLAARLGDLDLDRATTSEVLAALNDDERATFTKMLKDPNSKAAKEVLSFHDVASQSWKPWWESENEDTNSSLGELTTLTESFDAMLSAPTKMCPASHPILYNVVSVLLSYAFTTRHLATSPLLVLLDNDQDASREDIAVTAPFLLDRRSTVAFRSVEEVITELWSRDESFSNALMIRLLQDALILLKFPPLMPPEYTPPPHLLLVFSDLFHLFQNASSKKWNLAAMKVRFYAAQARSAPASALNGLRLGVEEQIEKLTTIEQERSPIVPYPAFVICNGEKSERGPTRLRASSKSLIEEL